MAGIGFKIEKILGEDTYIASMKAYFYSALISAGPWILSIVTIFCLNYFSPDNIDTYEIIYFRCTIIYIFAFSLIVAGILYLSLSRYLADRLYLKDEEVLIPAFNSSVLFILIIQAIFGSCFFSVAAPTPVFAVLSVCIYMTISIIWVIMIFLTTLRDYRSIIIAFAAGSFVAVFGGLFLGDILGLEGYFLGYFFGHLLIAAMLAARIFVEFRSKRIFDLDMFIFLLRNKKLVLIGVTYNIAIWIDKILFWGSPRATNISPWLNYFPIYEGAVFFAYLTIIPALSIFLIHIETDFYRKYRMFYSQILDKGGYTAIRQAKSEMARSLRASIVKLMTYQGIITLFVMTFAPELASLCRLKAVSIPIFRISCLGAFLQSMLLVTIIIILYFDFQVLALAVTLTFMATNWIFTYFTLDMTYPFLGYGYFASCFVSLVVAFYFLDFKFKRLEYLTFATQPLAIHREEEVM